MKFFRRLPPNVFWALCLRVLVASSGWQPVSCHGRGLDSIAVMNWQGNGINQEIDTQLKEIVYLNLQTSGRYTVLKPEQAEALLSKKAGPELADCDGLKCLNQLGQALMVDKVLLGEVNKEGEEYKIAFRIFDAARKEIIASAENNFTYPSEQFKDNVEDLARKLLKKVPLRGKVVAVSDHRVTLDVGSNVGLKKDKRLRLFRLKEVWAGNRLLYMGEKLVGDIKLVWVDEETSEATIERSYVTVRQGDLVDIKDYLLFSKLKPKETPVVAASPQTTAPPLEQQAEPAPISEPEPVQEAVQEEIQEPVPDISIGTLTIISNPSGAEITLDGESISRTRKTIPNLKVGVHEIKLSKRAYRNWAGKVTVNPDRENSVKVDLAAYGGKLNLSSIPAGATITIGKRSWGKTNKTLRFPPGSYLVKLTQKGYLAKSQRVEVKDGETTNLRLTLTQNNVSKIPDMAYIPEGNFTMGAGKREADEGPSHKVYVANFYIDRYEVSYQKYQKFLTATGRRQPDFWNDNDLNKPNLPVVGVSWEDAKAYCKWDAKRLPSEAEWEKAARGTDGRKYPWGNTNDSTRTNAAGKKDGFQFTAPVNSFASGASPFGAINMAGNVWEWCADWYAEDYYANSPSKSPTGQRNGELRVIRGGSWEDAPDNLRTTNRHAARPNNTAYNVGFRCAK